MMDIRTSDLGTAFTTHELAEQAHVLYGGVAWPGKRPGFAVVLALGKEQRFDGYDLCLLDETESADTRELVHRMAGLGTKYAPARWIGDNRNGAADRFLHEWNAMQPAPLDDYEERRCLCLCRSGLLEIDRPYEYLLPTLKSLLDKDRRRLFLKDSRIIPYLGAIVPDEIPFLAWGDFPAIEALGLAVHQLGYWRPAPPERRYDRQRERFRKASV